MMLFYSSTLIIAFTITISMIPILFRIAVKVGLLDQPDHRKLHKGAVPLIGGLAIFFGTVFSLVLSQQLSEPIIFFLISATLIVTLGVADDLYQVSAMSRVVVELIATLVLCLGTGVYLNTFGNLFGLGIIGPGAVGYLVTCVAVVGAINAYNMIDGIDGLVGASAIISFTAIAILFYISGQQEGLMLSVTFIVALLPCLAFNLSIPPIKAKIFMGDAGSMLIGLTVAWLLLFGSQSSIGSLTQSFRPVTALWVVAVPLMDMAAIMLRRYRLGQSVFAADRGHLHHLFMQYGFTSRHTLLLIMLLTIFTSGVGVLGEIFLVPDVIMFIGFLMLFVVYSVSMSRFGKVAK